jgi:hypothetical protein
MNSPKIVVYTAISQGYDVLKPAWPLWKARADFVAFLDAPQPAPGWEIRPLHQEFKDPCRNAKIHKLLPHLYFPDADYSLWIDGSIETKSTLPIGRWADEYLREHDLALFKHPSRNCVYEEAMACLKGRSDDTAIIERQMQKYCDEGYPFDNGSAECTVLFRRHTKKTAKFNEAWWTEIKAHSRRDQLSFAYAAHKLGFKYTYLPGLIFNNPHFRRGWHTAKRSTPE